jgi:hypothetical protein
MNRCANCLKETNNPKFCCLSCSAKFNNHIKPKRIAKKRYFKCLCCKKKTQFYTNNPRKYCSKGCQITHQRSKSDSIVEANGFGNGHYHNATIRKYLIRKHGNNCMICGQSGDSWNGKPITLIVDHVDGKSNNNMLDNLRIVCPNCDCQLPTYKAKNKGNSTRKYFIVQK